MKVKVRSFIILKIHDIITKNTECVQNEVKE